MNTDKSRSSSESNSHRFSIDGENPDYQKEGLLGLRSSRTRSKRWIPDSWFNILVSLNAGFSLFLALGFVLRARDSTFSDHPTPPYCKYARTAKFVPAGLHSDIHPLKLRYVRTVSFDTSTPNISQ